MQLFFIVTIPDNTIVKLPGCLYSPWYSLLLWQTLAIILILISMTFFLIVVLPGNHFVAVLLIVILPEIRILGSSLIVALPAMAPSYVVLLVVAFPGHSFDFGTS